MVRRSLALGALVVAGIGAAPALAQSDAGPGPVEVVEVTGPLDQRTMDFIVGRLTGSEAQLVVLHLDAPGIASGDPEPLFAAVGAASVPTAMWAGPVGTTAYGGVAHLLELVDVAGGAPGARVGYSAATVGGGTPSGQCSITPVECDTETQSFEITENGPNPAAIRIVEPTIAQFVAALDGMTIDDVTLETAETVTADDGTEVVVTSVPVRFVQPGLFTRFLRLSIRPEGTFLFLVAGLTLVVFELYAAGAGIAASVAVLSLFLAGYGLATLPMNWVSVAAVLVGLLLYAWEFQRNRLGIGSALGTLLLLGGGLTLTTARPQFAPAWWAVVLVVIAAALFFLFAMGSVVRSRFSTRTIGRDHLVGRSGVAETAFDPEGVVVLDGARWRARAHRAAGIRAGDPVEVVGVEGILLEVGPTGAAGET
jgi:membrane-bound ClpP family serine protease